MSAQVLVPPTVEIRMPRAPIPKAPTSVLAIPGMMEMARRAWIRMNVPMVAHVGTTPRAQTQMDPTNANAMKVFLENPPPFHALKSQRSLLLSQTLLL